MKTPIGRRLLRTMGWRDGEGIGARVVGTRKPKPAEAEAPAAAAAEGKKVYGVAMPPPGMGGSTELTGDDAEGLEPEGADGEEDAAADEAAATASLGESGARAWREAFAGKARADVNLYAGHKKEDLFGIGFDPVANAGAFADDRAAAELAKQAATSEGGPLGNRVSFSAGLSGLSRPGGFAGLGTAKGATGSSQSHRGTVADLYNDDVYSHDSMSQYDIDMGPRRRGAGGGGSGGAGGGAADQFAPIEFVRAMRRKQLVAVSPFLIR